MGMPARPVSPIVEVVSKVVIPTATGWTSGVTRGGGVMDVGDVPPVRRNLFVKECKNKKINSKNEKNDPAH